MSLEQRRNWARRQLEIAHEEEIPSFLQWLANGPICQPWSIYCPAGRLTWAETKAREAAQVSEA
jgi:hypothetical protein